MIRIVSSFRIGVCVSALTLAGLACEMGLGGPTPPASPIPVSTEAAGELEELWRQAIANAQNGEVTVVMTEAQLTSYVALKLAEEPDSPLEDVQIFLRDGKLTLQGQAALGELSVPATVVMGVTADANGQLALSLEDADFGPMPVPQSLLEGVSDNINNLIAGQSGLQANGVTITSIAIADGQMTVIGTVDQ